MTIKKYLFLFGITFLLLCCTTYPKSVMPYSSRLRVFVTPEQHISGKFNWHSNSLVLKSNPYNEFELFNITHDYFHSGKLLYAKTPTIQIGDWYITGDTLHLVVKKRLSFDHLIFDRYNRYYIADDSTKFSLKIIGNDTLSICDFRENIGDSMIAYPKLVRAAGYSLLLDIQ